MISIITITALIVLFFHVCTWKGMVFSFVSEFFKDFPDYIKKPLYDCPICMAPWWGPSIVACGIAGDVWMVSNVWQLLMVVAGAAGVNTLLIYIINQGKALAKAFGKDYECNCSPKEQIQAERQKRLSEIVSKSII